jgi:hypothetical protein
MENRDTKFKLIVGVQIIISLTIFIISLTYITFNKSRDMVTSTPINDIKEDSLHNVIDSLQTEIFYLEDEFDEKEHRYESIISEYEIGLVYLKDYHSSAYKDFHRIIGMKEQYNHQLDRENKKRLKSHE